MTEKSGFWTTDGATPEGHQVASYDQSEWMYAGKVLAACAGFEGIAPGRLNELEGTVTGANTVAINTGCGMVDGKYYWNSASIDVNIPSAGSGKTRIDRIVLRASWAGFIASIVRIEGTESSGTPSAPAITQTSGTTYDITLYQALVNSSGTVTLTDERTWAVPHTDGTTLTTSAGNLKIKDDGVDSAQIAAGAVDLEHMSANSVDSDQYVDGSIDTAHIAASQITNALMADDAINSAEIADGAIDLVHMSANSVDSDQYVDGSIDLAHMSANSVDSDQYVDGSIDAVHLSASSVTHEKLGAGAPGLPERQGGSATNWHIAGANNYEVGEIDLQVGTKLSSESGDVTITFPRAFSAVPIVFIQAINPTEPVYVTFIARSASVCEFSLYNSADARVSFDCYWMAVGPE